MRTQISLPYRHLHVLKLYKYCYEIPLLTVTASAFIRLVGVAYFEKNRGAFDDDNPTGFSILTNVSQKNIKNGIMRSEPRCGQGQHLKQLSPSIDALQLHWLRTLWVADYWNQATRANINPCLLTVLGGADTGTLLTQRHC